MSRKVQTPETETPETETPEAETPETETPETETPETETPETDPLAALNAPEEMDDPAASAREIDPRIKAFVDNGLMRTIASPRKWSVVKLPENEVKRVTREAKRYARDNGMTFRIKNTGDPARIVYRVTSKAATGTETGGGS